MSNSISSESSVEARLSELYARRAIIDDLIRSLELYDAASNGVVLKKGARRKLMAGKPVWAEMLAS